MILTNGNSTIYVERGRYHRVGGPAVMTTTHQEWFVHGIRHREDGPARMFKENRNCEWWSEGKYYAQGIIEESVFNSYWRD